MDDNEIIELYWQRSQSAVAESQLKYSDYCTVIAQNILRSAEDSEECVNDTWVKAWDTIPPNRPKRLSVFLGKITRNLAIDRYRKNNAEKYGGGQAAICLEELADCVGKNESSIDSLDLKEALQFFLFSLKPDARQVFMLRYWYMYPIKDIAKHCDLSEGAVKMSLKRTRCSLKKFLEEEEIEI